MSDSFLFDLRRLSMQAAWNKNAARGADADGIHFPLQIRLGEEAQDVFLDKNKKQDQVLV